MRARGGRAAMPRPFPLFALGPLLALYLKQADFVSLYVCYLFPPNLCRLFAQAVSRLLRGTHRFFALPEGYPKRLAAVAVDEGDHALEALHQPPPWQNNLPCLAQSFVNELWRALQETHPRMHDMPPFSHLALSGTFLSTTSMMPPGQAHRELLRTPSRRSSENAPPTHSGA